MQITPYKSFCCSMTVLYSIYQNNFALRQCTLRLLSELPEDRGGIIRFPFEDGGRGGEKVEQRDGSGVDWGERRCRWAILGILKGNLVKDCGY